MTDELCRACISALDRCDRDDDGRLQPREFAGQVLGLPGMKSHFSKIWFGIAVVAIAMDFHGLGGRIKQPRKLTAPTHVIQDRIPLIILRRHDAVGLDVLFAISGRRRITRRHLRRSKRNVQLPLCRYGLSLRIRRQREQRGRSECTRHTNVHHCCPPSGNLSRPAANYRSNGTGRHPHSLCQSVSHHDAPDRGQYRQAAGASAKAMIRSIR